MTITCTVCQDTFWVCESHPAMPWDGPAACGCGAAGVPCPACNVPAEGERRGCRLASRRPMWTILESRRAER